MTEVTGAAGLDTTIVAVPATPSAVAVIVADPCPVPETTPVDETVATVGALDLQVMARSLRILPAASITVAVNGISEPPTTVLTEDTTPTPVRASTTWATALPVVNATVTGDESGAPATLAMVDPMTSW